MFSKVDRGSICGFEKEECEIRRGIGDEEVIDCQLKRKKKGREGKERKGKSES
jgi:hypothetical protein